MNDADWSALTADIEPGPFPPPGVLEAYRFGWLSSFDGSIWITVSRAGKKAKMVGRRRRLGYPPARDVRMRAVGVAELRRLRADFEALMKDRAPERIGLDGASWQLDAFDGSEHQSAVWWSPEPGPIRDLGSRLVRSCGFEPDGLY